MTTVKELQLSPDQLREYRDQGFLVVKGLLTEQEVDAFVNYEATQDPEAREHLDNHKKNEHWAAIAKHPTIVGIARQILNSSPWIVQTMYLEKYPAAAGKGTALHQDSHYLPNDPNTLMACWCALSNTDGENGGLCVVPGSHLRGLFSTHKATNSQDHQVWEADHPMRDRSGKEWVEKFYSFEINDLDLNTVKNLEVPKGAGVFFTGMTIHGSYGNKSKGRVRRAFATHFVAEGTWLFRKDVQETVPAI